MSSPGQNDLPAPVTTIARTAGSLAAAIKVPKYASSSANVQPLLRCGRFSVSVQTYPSEAMSSSGSAMEPAGSLVGVSLDGEGEFKGRPELIEAARGLIV